MKRCMIDDWDAKAEQFVPQIHGRMNWKREDQTFIEPWRDFFASESVLTPDGRRVMWAWSCTLNSAINLKTIQSLPRELSLPEDGILRIKPLREIELLRYEPFVLKNITVTPPALSNGGTIWQRITELTGDAVEIRATFPREQANNKQFGFTLFSDGKGGGLFIVIRPETGTLRVGNTEAPFSVANLPEGEDVRLRIFIDKYLVEVFVNDRQTMIAAYMDYKNGKGLDSYTFGTATTISKL